MHTSIRVRIHCLFGTKSRAQLIPSEVQPKLWAYMRGIGENIGLEIMAIGGMSDHVHRKHGIVVPSLRDSWE